MNIYEHVARIVCRSVRCDLFLLLQEVAERPRVEVRPVDLLESRFVDRIRENDIVFRVTITIFCLSVIPDEGIVGVYVRTVYRADYLCRNLTRIPHERVFVEEVGSVDFRRHVRDDEKRRKRFELRREYERLRPRSSLCHTSKKSLQCHKQIMPVP